MKVEKGRGLDVFAVKASTSAFQRAHNEYNEGAVVSTVIILQRACRANPKAAHVALQEATLRAPQCHVGVKHDRHVQCSTT